jgi:DNA-binding LacI/PurR family transcriptional regulator
MKSGIMPSLPVTELKSKMAKNKIAALIRSGELLPGQKLPSENHLSQTLNINRLTVRKGLAELVTDGLIEKRPRVGTFVKSAKKSGKVGIALHCNYAGHEKQPPHPVILLLEGAGLLFKENGCLSCHLLYKHGQLWADVGEVAVANGIEGILLQPGFDTSVEDLEKFLRAGIKLVLFGYHPAALELGIPNVWLDTGMAIAQIFKKMVELGHKRIAIVRETNSMVRAGEDKLLQDLCRRFNLAEDSAYNFDVPNENNVVDFSGIHKLFEQKEPPTAVIAADDIIANEVFRQCYARRLRVPDDISLAARWDAMPGIHPVPLTAPDCLNVGRQAMEMSVKMLLRLLNGEQLLERSVTLRCDVQWKASTGPVPKM